MSFKSEMQKDWHTISDGEVKRSEQEKLSTQLYRKTFKKKHFKTVYAVAKMNCGLKNE